MSGQPVITEELGYFESQHGRFAASTLSDYWALTKPEVNFLILITTGVGFYLGSRDAARPLSLLALFNTLLGTLLVASGNVTSIHSSERWYDGRLRRMAGQWAKAG